MKKLLVLFCGLFVMTLSLNAQSLDELKAMQAEKAGAAAALQAEADALQKQIDEFPGWKFSGLGILGLDFAGNSDWFAIEQPQSRQNSVGLGFSAFANLDQPKYFWRNALVINMRQIKSKENADATEVESITDALELNSLYGYKLNDKIAISAEGRMTTTVLQFLDPGKITASAGLTWTPIPNLLVLVHPLGYELNLPSGDLLSAPGAKIGATYTREILPGVAWNSNLSAFLAYSGGTNDQGVELSAGDLSNWTWINGFGFNIWKGIGVGLNVGLRQDKQLAYLADLNGNEVTEENPLQFYYNLGLSYGF